MKTFAEFLEDIKKTAYKPKAGIFLTPIADLIADETDVYKNYTYNIVTTSELPKTSDIPKEDSNKVTRWLRIDEITCCFVDMVGSTALSTRLHAKSTAEIYRYFTGTAVKIFRFFESPYIDVKGDGVFALFDKGQEHRALAATITFKTFVQNHFKKDVLARRNMGLDGHYGIDRGTVLVRRIGIRKRGDDDQGRNEVWAGKIVNRAAKLAGQAGPSRLLVSSYFHGQLNRIEALKTCGCDGNEFTGEKIDLWREEDLSAIPHLKLGKGMSLGHIWCETHGREFCEALIK